MTDTDVTPVMIESREIMFKHVREKLWADIRRSLKAARPAATDGEIENFIREVEAIHDRIFGPPPEHVLRWYNSAVSR